MVEESPPPLESGPKKVSEALERTIWDNTPEEEQREIELFMGWAWMELEATLPPYDWGEKGPPKNDDEQGS